MKFKPEIYKKERLSARRKLVRFADIAQEPFVKARLPKILKYLKCGTLETRVCDSCGKDEPIGGINFACPTAIENSGGCIHPEKCAIASHCAEDKPIERVQLRYVNALECPIRIGRINSLLKIRKAGVEVQDLKLIIEHYFPNPTPVICENISRIAVERDDRFFHHSVFGYKISEVDKERTMKTLQGLLGIE